MVESKDLGDVVDDDLPENGTIVFDVEVAGCTSTGFALSMSGLQEQG